MLERKRLLTGLVGVLTSACALASVPNWDCCEVTWGTMTEISGGTQACSPANPSIVCETGTTWPSTGDSHPQNKFRQQEMICYKYGFTTTDPPVVADCNTPPGPGWERLPGTLGGGKCCYAMAGTYTRVSVRQGVYRFVCNEQCKVH